VPGAVLHCFGGVDGGPLDGVEWHPAPADSALAFAAGAVVAIPERHPTGIPVKGLEAWARGLPLIGSSQTAAALEATAGEQMLVADDPEAFASGLERLSSDAGLRRRVVDGGRARLRSRHDPADIADTLSAIYLSLDRAPRGSHP
jgi:glycosyltransferase involved in cell wall biosynthesis